MKTLKIKLILLTMSVLLNFQLAHARELKVALVDFDYKPYYFMKDGKLTGAAVEIAEIIAKRLGHTLKYERYPTQRGAQYLAKGKLDMSIFLFKAPYREKIVMYTKEPHLYESTYLLSKTDKDVKYDGTLKSVESLNIGHIVKHSYGKEFDEATHIEKVKTINATSLISMLVAKRFDLAIGNKPALLQYIRQMKLEDKITFLTPALYKEAGYFCFSRAIKDTKKLTESFNSEVLKVVKTSQYKSILKKYGLN